MSRVNSTSSLMSSALNSMSLKFSLTSKGSSPCSSDLMTPSLSLRLMMTPCGEGIKKTSSQRQSRKTSVLTGRRAALTVSLVSLVRLKVAGIWGLMLVALLFSVTMSVSRLISTWSFFSSVTVLSFLSNGRLVLRGPMSTWTCPR